MKFNLTGVKAYNLDKTEYKANLCKAMGDVIYTQTAGIKYLRIAEDIYDGTDVELDELDVSYFIRILESDACATIILIKKVLINELQKLLTINKAENGIIN